MGSKPISEKRPWVSNSLGVHPSEVKAANEVAKKHGYRHRYNEKGQVVATSNSGRKDACEMQHSVDYDGGYSDRT